MIRVGTAGWSYADWRGRVYPRTKADDFHPLEYLAQFFECSEVNSTFYALPNRAYVVEWVRRTSAFPNFRFLVKLHRDFTHGSLEKGFTTRFLSSLEPLLESSKLGALLAQFHQGFSDSQASRTRLLQISNLFGHTPVVYELRNLSWFTPSALGFLQGEGINLAHIDMPPSPTVVPEIKDRKQLPYFLGPLGYLRLHGRNSTDWYDPKKGRDDKYNWMYSREDIGVFAGYARKLEAKSGDTYVVTNNHFGGKAVANALEVIAALTGKPVKAPPEIVVTYPNLRDVVVPAGQQGLF